MFNYNKPGKGVSENEPEKNILVSYFSILWRKFRRFIGINLLYLSCVLPLIAIVAIAISPFLMDFGLKWSNFNYYICFVMMYLVFIGIAPVSIGAAAVFKSYSREQHSWVVSDFFKAIKENFSICIKLFFIDMLFTVILVADLFFLPAFQGMAYLIVSLTTYVMCFLFIAAHFYVYQIILMFDVTAINALKNAVIIAVAKLPQSFLLFVILLIAGVVINNPFTFLFIGYAPLSFASNMYAERLLSQKYLAEE